MRYSACRQAAVAGRFYPSHPDRLRQQVQELIERASPRCHPAPPEAIIVPHAGYRYSGAVAASAYQCLQPAAHRIKRVVLLGPSHYLAFAGLALSHYQQFASPLGALAVDRAACERIQSLPQVKVLEAAHAREHCLEVQLPFLQIALPEVVIVPLVVGSAAPEAVAEILALLWNQATLVLVSSDLSHYLSYAAARVVDARTCRKIEQLDYTQLQPEEACGAQAIAGLLQAAGKRGLRASTLDLRNSGDTAGSKDSVVGYGAWSFAAA